MSNQPVIDPSIPSPADPSPSPTGRGGAAGGGSVDVIGNIPVMPTPAGQMQIVKDGQTAFRAILDRFEGVNLKQSPMEIGELQAVNLQNLLTDEATLRKRAGSEDISGSAATTQVGLHEVSGPSSLTLQVCDDSAEWTESDAVNFVKSTDSSIKIEGTASLKMDTTGPDAHNDTITHDLGAGATKDLRPFSAVEVYLRGTSGGTASQTLYPNGAGDVTELTPSAGANWQNVDETPHDGDTTYNRFDNTGIKEDLYHLTNLSAGVNVIQSVQAIVTVRIELGAGQSVGAATIRWRTGGATYSSSWQNLYNGTYTEISDTKTVNPQTGVAWTEADINAVQVGIKAAFYGGTGSAPWRITQLRLVVTYTTTAEDRLQVGISEDNSTFYTVNYTGTTDEWTPVRLDLSDISDAAKDAVRYLRFRYNIVSGTPGARTFRADIIRAVGFKQHLLRSRYLSGTAPSGGVRDVPGTMTVALEQNYAGAWNTLATYSTVPSTTKVRAVDWLGTSFIMGGVGPVKYAAGALSAWTEAPPSRFIELHYEKLWAFNGVLDPHALRHTDTNSSTSWPTVAAPTGGNGGTMYVGRNYAYLPTGMKSAFGHLHLWTEGDLWILFGTDNTNFSLERAHPGAGTLSHESIARMDNGLIWHDGLQNRILWLMAGEVADISDNIRPLLVEIPAALKPWTAGFFDGRFYLFSYCRTGQTANDRCLVFDTLLRRWHGPFQGDWVGFNVGLMGIDGSRYTGSANGNGVRKALSGTTDAGAAVSLGWKSGALNFRLPAYTKRIRRAWVRCQNTTATLALKFYRDLEASPVRSYSLTFTGQPTEVQRTGVDSDVRADVLQVEITESSTGPVTINEIGVDGHVIRALR